MSPTPNDFSQAAFLGMTDMRFNSNTISVRLDPAAGRPIIAGEAVIASDVVSAVPMVLPSDLQSDVVVGYAVYNLKDQAYEAGDHLEISLAGNVMYVLAGGTIARWAEVTQDDVSVEADRAKVLEAVPAGGLPIVGYALDKGTAGQLMRIYVLAPSGRVS